MRKDTWFVAAFSSEVTSSPLAREFFDTPMVLIRYQGTVVVYLDRCPHKNVPLSIGAMTQNGLRCAYHGWQFNEEGILTHVPSIKNERVPKCKVRTYRCVEKDSYIWLTFNEAPVEEAPDYPLPKKYQSFSLINLLKASPDLILENGVDCTHTAWVHDGLFRNSQDAKAVHATISSEENGIAIETVEPEKAKSHAMRFLPSGEVRHIDRFIGPHTIRVDYWMGPFHNVTLLMVTPKNENETHVFMRMDFKSPLSILLKPFLKFLVRKVMAQDKVILEAQDQCIRKFSGRDFTSVEADIPANTFLKAFEHSCTGGIIPEIKTRKIQFRM